MTFESPTEEAAADKPKRKGRKRFQVDSSIGLYLMERDIEIICEVHKYRFMTTKHLLCLFGSRGESKQGIYRRLYRLYHNGYLYRFKRDANVPIAYALGNKGAQLLSERLDIPMPAVDWTSKNRDVGNFFLDHTLMITEFMVIVRLACEASEHIDFIDQDEIIAGRTIEPTRAEKPLSWRLSVTRDYPKLKRRTEFSIIPDGAFGLRITDAKGNQTDSFFFIEGDRSTMPIHRADPSRSSFYKKLVGYWESSRQKLYGKNFNFKNPRILTLTLSRDRAINMIRANQKLDPQGQGFGLFLFAPLDTFSLEEPEKVFERRWANGLGKGVDIVSDKRE